jgi:hypothetical protein
VTDYADARIAVLDGKIADVAQARDESAAAYKRTMDALDGEAADYQAERDDLAAFVAWKKTRKPPARG